MSDTKIKLDTPFVRVTYVDGTSVDVQTENPDMVFFDFERARRKWPSFQEAPFIWLNYLAYSKLKRSHVIDNKLAFEDWLITTVAVDNLDEHGNKAQVPETAGPTLPAPEAG